MWQSADDLSWITQQTVPKVNILYGDGLVLVTASMAKLQRLIDKVSGASTKFQLEINSKTSKTISETMEPDQLTIQQMARGHIC